MDNIVWNNGNPPKRGVYRVKSDGPSPNKGYRYWYGDRWSNLASKRQYAAELGKDLTKNRNTPLKYSVLWATKKNGNTGSDE